MQQAQHEGQDGALSRERVAATVCESPMCLRGRSGHTGTEVGDTLMTWCRPTAQAAPSRLPPGAGRSLHGRGCSLGSEAVGRVGDPVGRLLLGALGGAVGREEGLVSLGLLALGDGPLRGATGRLPGFPRGAPASCWEKEKPDALRLELKIIPNTTFPKGE